MSKRHNADSLGERTSHLSRVVLLGCSLLHLAGCASAPPSAGAPFRSPPRAGGTAPIGVVRTIVIDAGHGGQDPGTSHYGLREKTMALDIAKRLRNRLQQAGLRVVMTRETDQFIPLSRRPAIANRLQADLFVSIHINANPNRGVTGSEVYYPRVSVVSSDANWPPGILASEIGIPSTTVKDVLWDFVLRKTRLQSRRLASSIGRSLRSGLPTPYHGSKAARFVVLRESWMPSVLVEVGYVTNRAEAQRLATPEYREAASGLVADGILAYIRDVQAQDI